MPKSEINAEIERRVSEAPPLSPEQLERLRVLLAPTGQERAA